MLTLVSFFQHQTWQLTEEQLLLLWVNWLHALNSSSRIFPLLPLLIHSIFGNFARFCVFFCCCFVFFSVIEWVLLNIDIYDHATSCSSSILRPKSDKIPKCQNQTQHVPSNPILPTLPIQRKQWCLEPPKRFLHEQQPRNLSEFKSDQISQTGAEKDTIQWDCVPRTLPPVKFRNILMVIIAISIYIVIVHVR